MLPGKDQLLKQFKEFSPVGKLSCWAVSVVLVASIVQLATWTLGIEFDILSQSNGGRAILLTIAIASLVVFMGIEQRPLADFGLQVQDNWWKHLFGGFAIGIVFYAAYCGIAVMCDVASVRLVADPMRTAKAFLTGMQAFPLALTQQILVSGFLLSMLRDRYNRVISVIAVSLMFALMQGAHHGADILEPRNLSLCIGMFFVAACLATVRLYTGNIFLSGGLLAGCIFLRKVFRKTYFLDVDPSEYFTQWFMPFSDARQGPMMWASLAVATLVMGVFVWKKKETIVESSAEVAVSFKKYFPFSGFHNMAPIDVWLKQLWKAKFQVGFRYFPRLGISLAISTVNSIVSLPERLLLPLLLRNRKVSSPVFILGVHRSGTTHLHNLLSLDSQYTTPLAYHVINPVGCLFSGWLWMPILGSMLPWKRPMDNVAFHIFSPQEEEFAIANSSSISPYWGLTFPSLGNEFDAAIFPNQLQASQRSAWIKCYDLFMKKLTFWTGDSKLPLLKNPYNTGRVAILQEMYPDAKFIHIYRHPEDVYRSNAHMAKEGHCVTQLQDPAEDDNYTTRFLKNYAAMETACYAEGEQLPDNQFSEVCYEDLVQDPLGEIHRLYSELELDYSIELQEALSNYLESVAGYQKNKFRPLPAATREEVYNAMKPFFVRWNYQPRGEVSGIQSASQTLMKHVA